MEKNSSKKGDIKISLLGLLIGISLIVAGVYGIVSNKTDNDIITFLLCCMAIPVGAVVVIIMVLDIFKRASVKRT